MNKYMFNLSKMLSENIESTQRKLKYKSCQIINSQILGINTIFNSLIFLELNKNDLLVVIGRISLRLFKKKKQC